MNHFFYRYGLIAAILLFTFSCNTSKDLLNSKKGKYNVLWLVIEDQSPQFFSFHGDKTISLPNIERLAKEGIIFDNAYATVPVCAPARSSIITGMYPSTLGSHNMRVYSAYNKANQPTINVPSYSPIPPAEVKPFTEYLRKAGYYCSNNNKEDYNFRTLAHMWDESGNKATWRNKAEGQAFFSVFNFGYCHESGIWRFGKEELFVDPAKVPVPPYFPEDDTIRHDLAVNYSNLKRIDDQIGEVLNQLEEDGLLDQTIIFFYSDHGGPFPRHKRSIYETGTKVPMVVRYPDGFGKGTRRSDFVSFIDLAPTVLTLAGVTVPDHMQGEAFLGKADTKTKRQYLFTTSDRFDGQYDRKRAVRNNRYKYIRNYYTDVPYALAVKYRLQMPMMRQLIALNEAGQLKGAPALWMAKGKPKEELYDLEKDPFELNNLATDPTYQQQLKTLSAELDKWIITTGDQGEVDERELIDRWFPNGKSIPLAAPEFSFEGDQLSLSHEDANASLIWQSGSAKNWNIYTQPIDASAISDTIRARAVRIGYQDGEVSFVKR